MMNFDTLENILKAEHITDEQSSFVYDFQQAFINKSYNKNPAAVRQQKVIMMEVYNISSMLYEKFIHDAGQSIYDFNGMFDELKGN